MILFQMVEAGVVPNENRNPLLLGTFVLLFFGTFFLHINKHFNLMRFFKKKKAEKRGPAPKTISRKANSQRKPVPADATDLANTDLDKLTKRVTEDEENEELKAASLDDDGFDSGKTNSDPKNEDEKNQKTIKTRKTKRRIRILRKKNRLRKRKKPNKK